MDRTPLKLIFMGTPEFSVPCLQALIESEHEVVAVYCQPPRKAGRGHKLRPSPIQRLAEKYEIPVFYPTSLKSEEVQQQFSDHNADAAIVAAYGLILPEAILQGCKYGCINVHPSALPRWRGAAPLQRTIMAGDTETAMCIMQMDAGLDTGDILRKEKVAIPAGMTAGELHDHMAKLAGPAVLNVLQQIQQGALTATPQTEEGVTYAEKILKDEAKIDWNKPAEDVLQHILGLSPYPGAYFELNNEKIKVLNAEMVSPQVGERREDSPQPGTTLDDELRVACGVGTIQPTLLQRPGKKPMPRESFLRGYEVSKNTPI